jgi:hypothetical protein
MSLTATEKEDQERQRGQIMPLGLAGLVCCVLLLGLVFRLGQRGLQQERVRMRADATAYSGGIELARCLNILSLSEKMRITARDAIYTEELAEVIGKFQKVFIQAAPWALEADAIFIGYQNQVLAIPEWNQADMTENAFSGMIPSLKVSENGQSSADVGCKVASRFANPALLAFDAAGLLTQSDSKQSPASGSRSEDSGFASLGGVVNGLTGGKLGGTSDQEDAYHYQSKDGESHDLDQDQAGAVQEHDSNGGTVTRYKDNQTHKYVAKGKSSSGGLSDQGGHFLGIWAVQNPGDQNPGWVLACSQVRVAGGDVDSNDGDHGADYRPFFVPVRGQTDGGDDQGDDQGNGQNGGASGDFSAILGLANGLGMALGPVKAAINAGSQFMEIQH